MFPALKGSQLDAYAKQWRLFADIFNNVGVQFLILTLTNPEYCYFTALCIKFVS